MARSSIKLKQYSSQALHSQLIDSTEYGNQYCYQFTEKEMY